MDTPIAVPVQVIEKVLPVGDPGFDEKPELQVIVTLCVVFLPEAGAMVLMLLLSTTSGGQVAAIQVVGGELSGLP